MKKIVSITAETLFVAFTVIVAFGLFLLICQFFDSPYYDALYSLVVSDYIRLKEDFGRFSILLFIAFGFALLSLGTYYLFVKAIGWLRNKENFVAINNRIKESGIYRRTFQIAVILIALLCAEGYIRASGYYPGAYYKDFRLVNTLEDCNFQFSDSTGLIRIKSGNKYIPPFFKYTNREGFRSKYEFDSLSIANLKKQGGKLIMFIGDSYTEGSSAYPRDSCFVELIDRTASYDALNFGMGGTDPLQYKLVALKYVPAVKPDAVVVVTCSNDIMQYDRIPTPNTPLYYFTNAAPLGTGWEAQKPIELGFKPNDILKTNEEAYEFYKKYYAIPETDFFAKLCSESAFTSRVWCRLHPPEHILPSVKRKSNLDFTYNNLKAIQQLCDSLRTPVMYFHIRSFWEYTRPGYDGIADYKLSFNHLPVHFITGLNAQDHIDSIGDTHLNNSGHAKFSMYVTAALDSVFAGPK